MITEFLARAVVMTGLGMVFISALIIGCLMFLGLVELYGRTLYRKLCSAYGVSVVAWQLQQNKAYRKGAGTDDAE